MPQNPLQGLLVIYPLMALQKMPLESANKYRSKPASAGERRGDALYNPEE